MLKRMWLVGPAALARDAVAAELPTLELLQVGNVAPPDVILVAPAAFGWALESDDAAARDHGAA